MLNEKASSKSQQRLMGMVYAYKDGKLDLEELPKSLADKIKDIADGTRKKTGDKRKKTKGMSKKSARDFASTKHDGLPEKVEEEIKITKFGDFIFEGKLNKSEIGDYLKSNCRSWEYDSDNLDDTNTLANHLVQKFNVSEEEAFNIAKDWTGYEEETEDYEEETEGGEEDNTKVHESKSDVKNFDDFITEKNVNLDSIDKISMDVPLFIRILEYAREDSKTDMDLHVVTENILKLLKNCDNLTMEDYNKILPNEKED